MTLEYILDLLQKYADNPVVVVCLFLFMVVKYILKPVRRIINRASDIMEEYFVIHEKEVGTLQRLCDRLDAVIAKLDSAPQNANSGAYNRIFRRLFNRRKGS